MYFVGNDTYGIVENQIDFYSSYAQPNRAIVAKGTEYFTLPVRIVDDRRLEWTEQFNIVALTYALPLGQVHSKTEVYIFDNDRKLIWLYLYAILLSLALIINILK